ncbi:MAG: hypothetical protein V8S32_10750 [Lachnospiraceae bacterium]
MSKFSHYLKNLIDQSGESIASVSRSTGAERTSIHKALSDDRILSYKTVQALARHFNLSIDERKEFFRLYDILLQGEETYENRQAVCRLLNDLASIRFTMSPPPEIPEGQRKLNRLIKGEYAVRSAIRSTLIAEASRSEDSEFDLFLPPHLDLTTELMELWLDNRKLQVKELLFFSSGKNSASRNLQLLRTVIPLCLASRGRYEPHYFCESVEPVSMTPMSHYIITPHYLIQLTEDLSIAQIRDGEELIACYRTFFEKLLANCEPLVQCTTDILEVLQQYITNTSPDSLQVMMSQPCPGRYITPEVISKYMINADQPYQEMYALVDRHFSVLRRITKNYCTIFTEKGLRDLAINRSMDDLPPQYVPPLEPADIRRMLQALHDEIEHGTIQGLIVRPMNLQLPDYLSLYADSKSGIHIYTTNRFLFGAYCCNIHIYEESLCRVFLDFIQSLPGSPMVYSKEETLHLLEQYIAETADLPESERDSK